MYMFIRLEKDLNIPYHLNPLVYDIHGNIRNQTTYNLADVIMTIFILSL